MKIHPHFRLNGHLLSKDGLFEVAYSWVKEGRPYEQEAGDFILDWLSNSDSILVETSGSTGHPKKITLNKRFMCNSALATGNFFHLEAKQKSLLCLPSKYIAGKMMMVRAMVLGLHLDVAEPSLAPLDLLDGEYDFVAMVPMQVASSIGQLHKVKKLIIGGAPIHYQLKTTLSEVSTQVYETYGMTETITHVAVKKISGNETKNTLFKTLPDVSVSIDSRSCLVIDAPKIANERIITNDLVELVNEECFKWLGRYDNIINSGGVKLVPEVIETKLSEIIKSRFFVAGLPDDTLGEKLILFKEGKENKKLIEKIKSLKTLEKFEIPKEIRHIKNFLETKTGKIDRLRTIASNL